MDEPLDALALLAVALGEPLTSDEQASPPHQIAQTRLAHLQCLVLLDNLEHGSTLKQIRPGGRVAVLITCRNQDVLAQFAVPSAHRRPLGRLPRPEGVAYLQSALGNDIHTPAELDQLADALRDLPLTLRIGARRVMEDPIVNGRIARFLARLEAPARLAELRVPGERDLDLVRLLDLSLESLSEGERHAFACLSVCAAKGFGIRAAAAATGLSDPLQLVARLARLSLLEVDQTTLRFRFHPLIDDYARHLADQWGLTRAARARHAEAMASWLHKNAQAQGAGLLALLADQEDIRHGMEHYAESGHVDLALLQGLARLVEQTALGEWHSALLSRLSQRFDSSSQDWLGAVLLLQRGKRDLALGRLSEARAAFEQSLAIGRALKDQRNEAMVLNSLGGVLRDLGKLDDARDSFEQSLAIGRALKDQRHEAMVLNNLGWLFRESGKPDEALKCLISAREISKKLGTPLPSFLGAEVKKLKQWSKRLATESRTLADYHLDIVKGRLHGRDWPGAILHLRSHLALVWDGPERHYCLARLGYACFRAHRLPEAIEAYRTALETAPLRAEHFANLGRALHVLGSELGEAESHLRQACQFQPENSWAQSWLGLLLADTGRLEEGEERARLALVGHELHAVLLHNLAQVLARYPHSRRDKLEEALDICRRTDTIGTLPTSWREDLATQLRKRLGSPASEQPDQPSRSAAG